MSPDDRFSIIGYTRDEILAGAVFDFLRVPVLALRRMGELYQEFGPLAQAAENGRIGVEVGEVYFLSPLEIDGFRDIYEQFANKYQVIHFFNDTALRVCSENHIVLPPTIMETTRANLPHGLGTSMRFSNYLRIM